MPSKPSEHEPDPIDVAVGARVRIRRKQIGVSQSALAEALGISFQQVQKYERGANRISASMLVRIGERLGVSVGELVGEAAGAIADDILLHEINAPGAFDLLKAFNSIRSPRVRNAVSDLARALAERPRGT